MPCCYHRLKLEKEIDGREYFSNFPVSVMLKSKFDKYDAGLFLRRPFLRLACQQTLTTFINMSDKEHQEHAENFLRRAALQKAAEEFDCNVTRLKRKTGKTKSGSVNFISYLENLDKNHRLVPKTLHGNALKIDDIEFLQKMHEIWDKNEQNLFLVEVLTAFQTSIQVICENILLLDRVQFLRENGVNCYIRKITDDNISPRCYAFIAIKE
ncbi:hypothetical protein HHI36_000941 [Cryptolaemus montrouzieri]|uniref:Uncharacterized protein n=1 Tax=Cryptolaemus montrouzieri TaxID=559131 RepID=A0ABD2P6S4_9CUCU